MRFQALLLLTASAGAVQFCFTCGAGTDISGNGDDSPCAIGTGSEEWGNATDCKNPDFDIMFCQVKREKGVWTRECCEGKDKCQDDHVNNDDGSTKDIVNCQEDSCNTGNPRANDATQVAKCYQCTGTGDNTACASASADSSEVKEKDCNHFDQDNTYCTASRVGPSWSRDCCEGIKDCKDRHEEEANGSTDDVMVCHKDLCNSMDPRDGVAGSNSPKIRTSITLVVIFCIINIL